MTSQIFQALKTVGELIREAREKRGLLLRQVASFLEIDQALLSKIERGERKATRENIIKLASFLELNEKELLVQYLSEKIAYDLQDEDVAKEALKVAEKKVEYLKRHK
ncbi:helix-turn-helix domain-containing protein [Candidatus Woesearchaeota archaeon]|jgi:transcriptional regulator with XRE-family HTH domain|nr:helix-turn-helix domain-containing protein [Candidatus Woesearchaeota archaeon]NMC59631.1 helix-turn-helix transcriptional regulator [Candidatus Methanofastidiosa archaeon]GIV30488.1 MAG: transcriptional regulator [Bacteroidia bacterium]